MNKIDSYIERIVSGIVAIIVDGCKVAQPSDATVRCIRIMVRSMFNWTRSKDAASVGFQVQQIVLMLMPDEQQEVVLHLFGQCTDLFMTENASFGAAYAAELAQRRQQLREQSAARQDAIA